MLDVGVGSHGLPTICVISLPTYFKQLRRNIPQQHIIPKHLGQSLILSHGPNTLDLAPLAESVARVFQKLRYHLRHVHCELRSRFLKWFIGIFMRSR